MKALRAASRAVCSARSSSRSLSKTGSRPATSAAVALDSYVEEVEQPHPPRQAFSPLSFASTSSNAVAGPSNLIPLTSAPAEASPNHPVVAQLVNTHNIAAETHDFPRSTQAWDLYMSLPSSSRRALPAPYLKQVLRSVVPSKQHIKRFLSHSLRLRNYKAIEDRGSILEARLQTVIADLRRSLSPGRGRSRASPNDGELNASDYSFAMGLLSPFGRLRACEDIWTEVEHTNLAITPKVKRRLLRRRIAAWGHFVDYNPVPPAPKSQDPKINELEQILRTALPTIVNEGPRVGLMDHPPLIRTLTLNIGKVANRVRDATLQQAIYGVLEGLMVKGYGVDMRYLTIAEDAKVPLGSESLNVLLGLLGSKGDGWKMVSALAMLGGGTDQAINPGKWDEDVDEDDDMLSFERSSRVPQDSASPTLPASSASQSFDMSAGPVNFTVSRFYVPSSNTAETQTSTVKETVEQVLDTNDEPRKFSDFYKPSYVPENPVSSPSDVAPRTFDDFFPSTLASETIASETTLYTSNIFLTMMDRATKAPKPDSRLALHVLRLVMLVDEAGASSVGGETPPLPLARARMFEHAWRMHHSSSAARVSTLKKVLDLARRHEQRLAERLVALEEQVVLQTETGEIGETDAQRLMRARTLLQQEKMAMEAMLETAQKEMLGSERKHKRSQLRFRRKRLEAKIAAVQGLSSRKRPMFKRLTKSAEPATETESV